MASSRGFTLIEILVVIIIIGVMVSAATLAIGVLGRDSQVEDESRRFWAVLRQAREESELQSLDVGVILSTAEYEFLRFSARDTAWIAIEDDQLYATRKLPEGLRFRLWLDGREIVLKPALEQRKPRSGKTGDDKQGTDQDEQDDKPEVDPDQPPPQIVILSSGEIMPFELQIERDGARSEWRVLGQADNDLRLERRADESRWQIMAQTLVARDEKSREPNARR